MFVSQTLHTLRRSAIALAVSLLLAHAAGAAGPSLEGTVNVNTATVEQLQLLPGIGKARAEALVALRKQRGGFKSLDELLEVRGIGAAGLEKLRPHASLSGKTTAQRR